MTTSDITEPTPAPVAEPEVGSASSAEPVPPGRDMLRALVCALLVAGCVASPASALVLAPFVPTLVAIRLLRQRAGARQFLVVTSALSVGLSLAAATVNGAYLPGVLAALALVPALGIVHARAARRDPLTAAGTTPEWPEPRLDTGFTPTVGAWLVATLLVAALALPLLDRPTALVGDSIRSVYSVYERECADDGMLANEDALCEEQLAARDEMLDLVDGHESEILAALIAIFAFGGAGTAHLIVLPRARQHSERIRPAWRLRELELHWSAAYVLAAGLVAWMLAGDGSTAVAIAVRSAGTCLAVLGALMVVSQGLGLVAWFYTRGGSPMWYRIALTIFALVVLPVTATIVFFLGVIDLAIHPRRRALARGR